MKEIWLENVQKNALVDDEDYGKLIAMGHWYGLKCRNDTIYAYHSPFAGLSYAMHNLIIEAPDGFELDHIDRNGLNNLRSNLRIATASQNQANKALSRRNTSGFRGVYWHNAAQKWMAQITVNNKFKYLGLHKEPEQAALAYNKAAKEAFGEFAQLNPV